MRTIILFLLPVFASFSCHSETPVHASAEDEDIIRVVFVTDRNGADVYADASSDSEIIGRYDYAAKLEVVATEGEWMRVKGMGVYDVGEGFIKKENTGKSSQIRLDASDLYVVASASKVDLNGNQDFLDPVSGRLSIDLVDRTTYEVKKKEAVHSLLQDTLAFPKKDGVLKLKCTQKTKTFTDNPTDEETRKVFDYLGQIKKLNAYLVLGTYWEEHDFILIDKTSAQEIQSFVDFPYLSADGKRILSAYSNPYEQTGDIALYNTGKQQTNLILLASFKNWMPSGNWDEQFWHADGYFYIPVVHSSAFWDEKGNVSKAFQYLRIKVL